MTHCSGVKFGVIGAHIECVYQAKAIKFYTDTVGSVALCENHVASFKKYNLLPSTEITEEEYLVAVVMES